MSASQASSKVICSAKDGDGAAIFAEFNKRTGKNVFAEVFEAFVNLLVLLILLPILCVWAILVFPCVLFGSMSETDVSEGVKSPGEKYKVANGNGYVESFVTNAQGVKLFYRAWEHPEPKLLVYLTHGMGEHTGRKFYQRLGQKLFKAGATVVCMDNQGHGCSEGTPGYVEKFDYFVKDFEKLMDMYDKKLPGVKQVMFGHSMGGLNAATLAIAHPDKFARLVVSSPALLADPDIATPLMKFLAQVLSVLGPKMELDKLDPILISRGSSAVKEYAEDPYNYHGGIRARVGAEMLTQFDFVNANLSKLTMPIFCLHGLEDKIVPWEASKAFYEGVASVDKTCELFRGGFHELHEDPEHGKKYMKAIVDFIMEDRK